MELPSDLRTPQGRGLLREFYGRTLVEDVLPFWLRHGLDRQHDGIMTCLDRDGSLLDTDKSIWFQGRAGWMFSVAYAQVAQRAEYLEAAGSCIAFLQKHGYATDGKLFFTVTREGLPLRMRRYVYSEAFSTIAYAAYAKVTGDESYADAAKRDFTTYLRLSFEPGVMRPKVDSQTRPMIGLGALMIGIVTAQEMRLHLGHVVIQGLSLTEWIDRFIFEIQKFFWKPDLQVLMETVAPDGSLLPHAEARLLNPGHAIECAWFILHEGKLRGEKAYQRLGCAILDAMWRRGWDAEHGGLLYFRDVEDKPVLEYWQDMKFWWPHCEGILATALAYEMTGDEAYAHRFQEVHEWSFQHFPDPEYGEWYGWLHRDGTPSQRAKGSLFKGPFHLPRMLAYMQNLLSEPFMRS